MAGHAARDRVNGVFHLDAFFLQHVCHLAQCVLGLRHRHAVTGHDDDLGGVLHDEAASSAEPSLAGFGSPVPAAAAAISPPKPPWAAD